MILKEMIFDNFYFGQVQWSLKNKLLTVSTLGRRGGLERTDL